MVAAGCDDVPPALAERALRAYGLEPEDSPWRALCCLFAGAAHQLGGDRQRARRVLQEGAGRGATGAPAVQTLCLAQLALLEIEEGDLDSAEAGVDRALAQVERLGIADYPTQASVFAVSALVRATRGRVEDAGRDLRRSQGLLAMLIDFLPWYGAQVRVTLARAALKLSDVPKARALLAEAAPLLRQVPDARVLSGWVDDARRQADTASDSAAAGGWVLTTAELRVLQFLPSHLSFPEVADQLCVSPNTVKSHARAVYRKLNATSRAEAVDRARDCGLLDTRAAV
jgi:LuxR family maltose regulon positive regulatory protein